MKLQRFSPKDEKLQRLIKYFWVIREANLIQVEHTLLPVGNIDFIINFTSPIKYTSPGTSATARQFHFNGLKETPLRLKQKGPLNLIGISFFPWGFYPFAKRPLLDFKNRTIDPRGLIEPFTSRLEEILSPTAPARTIPEIIEKALLDQLNHALIPESRETRLL